MDAACRPKILFVPAIITTMLCSPSLVSHCITIPSCYLAIPMRACADVTVAIWRNAVCYLGYHQTSRRKQRFVGNEINGKPAPQAWTLIPDS